MQYTLWPLECAVWQDPAPVLAWLMSQSALSKPNTENNKGFRLMQFSVKYKKVRKRTEGDSFSDLIRLLTELFSLIQKLPPHYTKAWVFLNVSCQLRRRIDGRYLDLVTPTHIELLLLANSMSEILVEPFPAHLSQKGAEGWIRGFQICTTQKEMAIISYAADEGAFSAQRSHSSSSDCTGLRSETSAKTTLNCVTKHDVMDRTARVAPWLPVSLLRRRRASRVADKYGWKETQTFLNEGGGSVKVLAC